jgi:hypothetical protein
MPIGKSNGGTSQSQLSHEREEDVVVDDRRYVAFIEKATELQQRAHIVRRGGEQGLIGYHSESLFTGNR